MTLIHEGSFSSSFKVTLCRKFPSWGWTLFPCFLGHIELGDFIPDTRSTYRWCCLLLPELIFSEFLQSCRMILIPCSISSLYPYPSLAQLTPRWLDYSPVSSNDPLGSATPIGHSSATSLGYQGINSFP